MEAAHKHRQPGDRYRRAGGRAGVGGAPLPSRAVGAGPGVHEPTHFDLPRRPCPAHGSQAVLFFDSSGPQLRVQTENLRCGCAVVVNEQRVRLVGRWRD
jgi:hypothetical protein